MANEIKKRIDVLQEKLKPENLIKVAFPVFVKNTPIKTGNARRNTKQGREEIEAAYAYAQRLDQGYSKQSPDGMTKPTIEYLQKYVRSLKKGT